MARASSIVAALVAAGAGVPAMANVFGADNRHVVAPAGPAHATAIVGSIVTNAPVPDMDHPARLVMTGATAFMVSPCHALTNFHAVFGHAAQGDRTHTVTMTIQGSKTYKVVGTPVTWGSLASSQDWALLKLTCVGLDPLIGWGIPAVPDVGADVQMTGFPGDKDRSLPWTSSCRIRTILHIAGRFSQGMIYNEGSLVLHDCATRDGSSGSPIYTTAGDGMPRIVALNAGEWKHVPGVTKSYLDRISNGAVLYSDVARDVQFYTNEAIGHFGVENPQIALARRYEGSGMADPEQVDSHGGTQQDDARSGPADVVHPRECPSDFGTCLDQPAGSGD